MILQKLSNKLDKNLNPISKTELNRNKNSE